MERVEQNPEMVHEPVKKRRWFESGAAQTLALFAALSGVYGGVVGYEQYQENQRIQEVQKEGLDTERIAKDFELKVVIPNKNHSVIHIKQTHSVGTQQEMETTGIASEVIRVQKQIGKLIEDLSERDGIKDFYDEGVAVDKEGKSGGLGLLKMLRDALNRVNDPNVSLVESATTLITLEELAETPHMFDGSRGKAEAADAETLYAIKIGWDTLIKNLDDAEAAEREGNRKGAPQKYIQFVEEATKNGRFKEAMNLFLNERSIAANDPLIHGDNIYLHGAEKKLYLEGKINIIPAETVEGNMEGRDIPLTSNLDTDKRFQAAVSKRNNIAIDRMTKDPQFKDKKFIPLIFGAKHNFEKGVEDYNHDHPSDPIGLIEIAPK